MNRAMFAGVAGLKTHQTKMDVIGNNIANVNTYGYKAQRAVFADLMYQNLRGASAGSANRGGTSPSSVGYGSALAGIQTQMTQSSMQSTGFGLDVAITGEGFLQVMDGDGNTFYTKAGMLDYDSQGYLTDINGNFVLGSTGKDGKPGAEKIRLDNVGSVDAKKPMVEQEINGVKYKIEASNSTKNGNVGLTLSSSEDLPAGLKAKAVISSTGAISVQLNAYETFDSLTDLNAAINAAITEANGGKQHAAGTFTISSDDNNLFNSAAQAGGISGSAFGNDPSHKAQLTGTAGNFFGGLLNISAFTPDTTKGVDPTQPMAGIPFTVTQDTPPTGKYTFKATINGVDYTTAPPVDATGIPSPIKLTSPNGGSIELTPDDTANGNGTITAADLATFAAAAGTPYEATSIPPKSFLGGATVESVSPGFKGSGKITFDIKSVNAAGSTYDMELSVGNPPVVFTADPSMTLGGQTTFKSADGDKIVMKLPSWADMMKNLGVDTTSATFATDAETALKNSAAHNDYITTPSTGPSTKKLTGAEIVGNNSNTTPGKFTGTGADKILDGLMKIMGTSSKFNSSGTVTAADFNATFDTDADGKDFWRISMTVGGKAYSADIYENTAASSILLKNSDSDYIQVSNPGFKALSDKLDATTPGVQQPLLDAADTITVTPATPSRDLGLGTSFALTGGTEGGTITLDELSSISIGADGTVSVSHPDKGVVVAGKISLANFANPSGLQLVGNNYYSASANSGEAKLCDPGSDGTGALKSSALEMSNVDMSGEFADMITTQRGFQANSRIITVSDTMLEELINLKR